ncbi:hypothetical protein [Motilibacter deserti]|uniref:Membrane-associated oxidoreductase n=1 Tax=Motilibacter deserti TaxID=2714956 RepID=A0ABX0GXD4_9ACTN|nr:hypothetical protein [Motilibacter deserti]NHC14341.1 hypothetical protein [Motilibacter deserti]
MSRGELVCGFTADHCYFEDPVVFDDASGSSITITNCHLRGLSADSVALTHNLELQHCHVTGEVRLAGARIAGQLNCAGTQISAGAGKPALTAFLLDVRRGVLLTDGFHCEGETSLQGATIGQFIDLSGATFDNPERVALEFRDLRLDGSFMATSLDVQGTLQLERGSVSALDVERLRLRSGEHDDALLAGGLECAGLLRLGPHCDVVGTVVLDHASANRAMLGGTFRCREEKAGEGGAAPAPCAFSARSMDVVRSFESDSSLRIEGSLVLQDARLGGDLDLSRADVEGPLGFFSVLCDRITVAGAMHLNDGFHLVGGVRLWGGSVGRDLLLGGRWEAGEGDAFSALRLKVGGSLVLQERLVMNGTLSAQHAVVEGDVVLAGTVGVTASDAVDLTRSTVKGSIRPSTSSRPTIRGRLAMDCVRAEGDVRLTGLSCIQDAPGEDGALPREASTVQADTVLLNGARIEGACYLNDFVAPGAVHLFGARVGGVVNLRGGAFHGTPQSLEAEGLQARSLLLDRATFTGSVALPDCVFGGLNATQSEFDRSVNCRRLTVTGPTYLSPARADGRLDLSHASMAVLKVNPVFLRSGPEVNGLTYRAIEGEPATAFAAMLPTGTRFAAQPYEQLASALRQSGHPEVSKDVLIEMRKHQLGAARKNVFGRVWSRTLGATVAFGYRPERTVGWLVLLGLLGALVCMLGHPEHFHAAREDVPVFNPWVYSFDTLLPIIDFRQQDAWIPGSYVRWWTWFVTAAGWILSTALVAGVTRAMSRT